MSAKIHDLILFLAREQEDIPLKSGSFKAGQNLAMSLHTNTYLNTTLVEPQQNWFTLKTQMLMHCADHEIL